MTPETVSPGIPGRSDRRTLLAPGLADQMRGTFKRTGTGPDTVDRRRTPGGNTIVDFKLELVLIPVSDVDRAKAFYTETAGFELLVDGSAGDGARIVQVTPPGRPARSASAVD